MRKVIRIPLTVAAILITTSSSMADVDPVPAELKTVLGTRLEGMTVGTISKSPIPGLYEVNVGNHILYSDRNGDYLVVGDMMNAKTQENLTQARLSEINRIDFSKLPFENAVKIVKGDGRRSIAVFTDPNCQYCKQLDVSLNSVDNVTIYNFIYPVLSPESEKKSKSIWCSASREKAWKAWMQNNVAPTATSTCDTAAIEKNIALGRDLNVDGTPTVFLADGRRLQGAVPADVLTKELAKAP